MLGELARKEEPDSGLDLARGDGGPFVVVGEARGLGSESLEDVVDEGVHDGHGLGGHAGVGVNLLEHLVDVDTVRFLPPRLPLLLVSLDRVLCSALASFFGCFLRNFGRHLAQFFF